MQRRQTGGVFECDIVSRSESQITLKISGDNAYKLFKGEAGGHRWQRVPPTEKRGRKQSSTVTVAVFNDIPKASFSLNRSDVDIKTSFATGPGGQKTNKTETAIDATHIPTGITAHCQDTVSQRRNIEIALAMLELRVANHFYQIEYGDIAENRRNQIGSGERSDKIRTVQVTNGRVVNNTTGKKCNLKSYQKGDIWKVQ